MGVALVKEPIQTLLTDKPAGHRPDCFISQKISTTEMLLSVVFQGICAVCELVLETRPKLSVRIKPLVYKIIFS